MGQHSRRPDPAADPDAHPFNRPEHHDPADRDETVPERADRNFNELLQELRVMQTGVQVLTGFLLTLPFQARFADLDNYQRMLYLILVVLSVVTTGVLIAPVSLHRALFRRGLKKPLVTSSNLLARLALLLLGLVVTGTAVLAFDVVVSRTAGLILGICMVVLLLVLWLLLPRRIAARSLARQDRE